MPLYIHIPYCISKCDYCDFFSVPCHTEEQIDRYITALTNEIHTIASELQVSSWQSVYVGGGTPSILNARQIERLFDAVWSAVASPRAAEVTFEANPRDITPQLLRTLWANGVTRISCGFQSFCNEVLRGVHRSSTAEDERTALDCLAQWPGVFSSDMIAGLPGDTLSSLMQGLETLAAHGAKHISLYTLTIEENTPLGKRMLKHDDTTDELYLAGREALLRLGYEQYEVSNFCQDGARCKHNEAYWRMQNYAGAGATAVSSFYGGEAEQKAACGKRITNTANIDDYIAYWTCDAMPRHSERAPKEVEVLDAKTMQAEYFMLGLRTAEGISEEGYRERFGCGIKEEVLSLFDAWQERGLCRSYESGGLHYRAMTPAGLMLLNRFLEEII